MTDQPRPKEKAKKDEKREEKDEKGREEKWRRDPLSAITWAAILIWAGVVLLLSNLNLLPRFEGYRLEVWSLILLGAGALILLEAMARLILPEYRRGVIGSVIVGLIFIAIGGGGSIGWGLIWPLVIIAIGLSILIRGLFRR